ncbi:MAG: hydrogenase expression/formation protein HypE [Armatimonadota bacterium]|nr:MAG: hydrogenase expression/formation protein HypE [Armatimonadota bacterium]
MSTSSTSGFLLTCPIPIQQYPSVVMAHGGGGRLMHQLIEKMFVATFGSGALRTRHDSARLELPTPRLAFTTDSYVVRPLFFPGGDIGKLAVYGTVNDLAMSGARPLYLSLGMILEEGLPMETLWRVVLSLHEAAQATGVQIVTGDTKVVDRGKGDGVFLNTSGVGVIEHDLRIAPQSVQVGDAVILSGDIGRHGIAVMAVREGLEFESAIESDCAPLAEPVLSLIEAGIEVHCLRDLTRGGLASACVEIAEAAGVGIWLEESHIPVREDVRGACEILGFDPLYVANEGRFVAFVPASQAEQAVEVLRRFEVCAGAQVVGEVTDSPEGTVVLRSVIGTSRVVDMLSGEQLPRIC